MNINKTNLKNIFFDAGGILFNAKENKNERIRKILKSMGEKDHVIENAISEANQLFICLNNSDKWLNNWEDEKEFFREYYSLIAYKVDNDDEYLSEKLFYLTHYANHCTIYPEVVAVLEFLSQKYKLAVISNAFPSLDWIFDKLEIRKYFYSITLSATVGVAKPDREIYASALEQAARSEER